MPKKRRPRQRPRQPAPSPQPRRSPQLPPLLERAGIPSPDPGAVSSPPGASASPELDAIAGTLEREDGNAQPPAAAPPAAEAAPGVAGAGSPVLEPAAELEGISFEDAADEAATLGRVIFGLIATRGGEHWGLKDEEAARLGRAGAPLVRRLKSRYAGVLMESAGLALVLVSIIVPRLKVNQQLAEQAHSVAAGDYRPPDAPPATPPPPPPPPAAVAGAGYEPDTRSPGL